MAKNKPVLTPFRATVKAAPKGYGRVEYDFVDGKAIDEGDAHRRAVQQANRDYAGFAVSVVRMDFPKGVRR